MIPIVCCTMALFFSLLGMSVVSCWTAGKKIKNQCLEVNSGYNFYIGMQKLVAVGTKKKYWARFFIHTFKLEIWPIKCTSHRNFSLGHLIFDDLYRSRQSRARGSCHYCLMNIPQNTKHRSIVWMGSHQDFNHTEAD